MFWADTIADEVERRYADRIKSGAPIVVRDEKTASGHVHVGSLRSASLHAIVADILVERGIRTEFHFEINDFDPMDGIPGYLDQTTYKKYMGVPLCNIPSPEPGSANFAEYYGNEYIDVLRHIGFKAQFYRASELYRSGAFNELIRKALDRRHIVRDIYFRISNSERSEDWYPLNVVCEQCGNLSATKITDWDGDTVEYVCSSDTIAWAEGCGHRGRISPFDGNAKFPWKLDWAAKFVVKDVQFEGGGKDHYTKGGSRQVAEAICREVFDHEPPYGVFNEFFLIGGKKMSSSKGNAATAKEMSDLLPPHILRLLLLKSPINRQINFDPSGDAVPILFDTYDRLAHGVWAGGTDDDARLFSLAHTPDERGSVPERYLPRFSRIAFLVQMPHLHIAEEVAVLKGGVLTDADVEELSMRAQYAKHWLQEYADPQFIFALQETRPAAAALLSEPQAQALSRLADRIETTVHYEGQSLHTLIHEVKAETALTPKEFFSAIYTVFLSKESGPQVGWFLSTLDRDFVVKRLRLEG